MGKQPPTISGCFPAVCAYVCVCVCVRAIKVRYLVGILHQLAYSSWIQNSKQGIAEVTLTSTEHAHHHTWGQSVSAAEEYPRTTTYPVTLLADNARATRLDASNIHTMCFMSGVSHMTYTLHPALESCLRCDRQTSMLGCRWTLERRASAPEARQHWTTTQCGYILRLSNNKTRNCLSS